MPATGSDMAKGSPSIGQVNVIGRFQLLPPLVLHVFAAPFGGSVAAVEINAGQVEFGPVPVQELYPTVLPEPSLAS